MSHLQELLMRRKGLGKKIRSKKQLTAKIIKNLNKVMKRNKKMAKQKNKHKLKHKLKLKQMKIKGWMVNLRTMTLMKTMEMIRKTTIRINETL